MINPDKITPDIAAAAEVLVDKRNISFDEAYLALGLRHEEPPRATQLRTVLSSYDTAREFQGLARRGSNDPEVRAAGGVRVCATQSAASDRAAHRVFFEMYGTQVELPPSAGADEQSAHDAAVAHWHVFRTGVLESPEKRRELDMALRDPIQEQASINQILTKYAGGA
jgi:hypothetical protein